MSLLNKFRSIVAKKALTEEIIENICDLLNTKKGYGTFQKDLGIDSYIHPGTDNVLHKKIIEEIEQCITKYENRIQIEEILPLPNPSPFFYSFVIKCKIQRVSHDLRIAFHTQHRSFEKEIAS
jgi:predicted component of type VI protein secretion system